MHWGHFNDFTSPVFAPFDFDLCIILNCLSESDVHDAVGCRSYAEMAEMAGL